MSIRQRNAHFKDWAAVCKALNLSYTSDETANKTVARTALESSENEFYYYVCYIKSAKTIYTHGKFYSIEDIETLINGIELNIDQIETNLTALSNEVSENEEVLSAAYSDLNLNKISRSELPNILCTRILYSDLKILRDSLSLIPGIFYRITDYVTTTTQENTQSAGHQFDIIVLATSESTLSEEAHAVLHDGDTYFANSNLSAWKLWYCLDNDTDRFAWADSTNGKGVIYRMIDEWNNDCPYDFKNILYAIYQITDGPDKYWWTLGLYQVSNTPMNNWNYTLNTTPLYAYTFCYSEDNVNVIDATVTQFSHGTFLTKNSNNVIRKHEYGLHGLDLGNTLPVNVFIGWQGAFFVDNEVVGYDNVLNGRCAGNVIKCISYSIIYGSCNTTEKYSNASNVYNIIFGGNNIIDNVSNCILRGSNCRYEHLNSVELGNDFNFSSLKNVSNTYICGEDPNDTIINYDIHYITDIGQSFIVPIGGEYLTKVTMDTSGVLKIYCEADLIA